MKLKQIVRSNLCVSCGACVYISSGKIRMHENKKRGIYAPTSNLSLTKDEETKFNAICPAMGYPIVSLSNLIHKDANLYDYRVGNYISYSAVKSNSSEVLSKASSGGIMTELAIYLLKSNLVQGVVATVLKGEGLNIIPQTKIFTRPDELLKTQGSKYMPVPTLKILRDVIEFDGQVAYIGTPCQIASIRLLQQEEPILKNKIRYVIGNFCGGFKDLREQYRLRDIAKMGRESVVEFQYRGDGQPGRMIFKAVTGKVWEYSYPDYSKLTGYMKYYRCRVCVDATAELADISCGDAWLPKFNKLGSNWSIIILRNKELFDVLDEMYKKELISKEKITFDELVLSQKQNLNSKKERYIGRLKFFTLLGFKLPIYDGGWNDKNGSSFLFEAKVYFSQVLRFGLEMMGLYSIFNKYTRKLLNK